MNYKQRCLHGDCIEVMDKLDEYHLVVTSPPYNVGIDYGEYKDSLPLDDYIKWLTCVFLKSSERLVPGGHICINIANTGRQPYIPKKDLLVNSLLNAWDLDYRGEIIWDKHNITAQTAWGSWLSPNMPSIRDRHEYIIVFRKEGARNGKTDLTDVEFMKYTQSLWEITPETDSDHPAPYPLELAHRLIKLYSFIGETVLDPFMGTGTTLKACRILNRNAIGIDLNEKYVDMATTKSHAKIPPIESW